MLKLINLTSYVKNISPRSQHKKIISEIFCLLKTLFGPVLI